MNPVNPEAIGLFDLIATVLCFGLEQVGVGVKGADHEKLTRSLGFIAVLFGGCAQLFTALCMYLFSVGGDHSIFLGTVFGFFGLFWVLVGLFFLKGGDKKVIAHFFAADPILCLFNKIKTEHQRGAKRAPRLLWRLHKKNMLLPRNLPQNH